MSTPEYLYHYTNIDTLALILKNKTIRFNSLDQMDDPQEKDTADLKTIGNLCYISSWTDDRTESIPMWKMYSSLETGVRIRLKANPFKLHSNPISDLAKAFNAIPTPDSTGEPPKSYIPIAEMVRNNFYSIQATKGDFLHKVEYTSDKSNLYPTIVSSDDEKVHFDLGKLGKYKNTHWKFQNEWRYIFTILPLDLTQSPDKSLESLTQIVAALLQGKSKQPFTHYDMSIDDFAFSQMEITLSPRITAGSKIIVESLIEKYNPSATVIDSSLIGLI